MNFKIINSIPFKRAVNTTLLLLSLVIVFHILVLVQLFPYQKVWGGRLHNAEEMQKFESVSITVNLIIIGLIALRAGYLKIKWPYKIVQIALALLVVLFTLNTIGNLFAVTLFEKLVFTPITLVLAILCYRIYKEPKLPI